VSETDALMRAHEVKSRRLAAERLELAEHLERELERVRAEADGRLEEERARVRRLEAELAEAQAALAELQRSKTLTLTAPARRVYYRLRGRR
jgi:hypothetical protein